MDIGDLLVQLGIYPNVKGFRYFEEAVDIINNDWDYKSTCALYAAIGSRCDTTGARVERCLRNAIFGMFRGSLAVDGTDDNLLTDIVGKNYSLDGLPTVGQFIFALARYCKKKGIVTHRDIEKLNSANFSSSNTRAQVRMKYIDQLLTEHYPEYMEELNKCEY